MTAQHNNERSMSDLEKANTAIIECDENGCSIVQNNWGAYIKANDITNNKINHSVFATPKHTHRVNIYHKQGTPENLVYRFCKKYKLSVRSTMSLLSFVSVIVCGIVIAGIADFLMQNAIFSIVDSVGILGAK